MKEKQKTCKRCLFTMAEKWFHRSFVHKTTRRAVCCFCLQEERDKKKSQNRAVVKARGMVYNHCKKYNIEHGAKLTPSQFILKFDWPTLEQMAHFIMHNYGNSCMECRHPYKTMGHGLADVTLDQINPNEPPYWGNMRLICATCNREKQHRGATEFGEYKEVYRARQEFINGKHGTPLKPQYRMDLRGEEVWS